MPEQKYQLVLTESQLNALTKLLSHDDLSDLIEDDLDGDHLDTLGERLRNEDYIKLDPES